VENKHLARIFELKDIAQNPPSHETYFYNFCERIVDPVIFKHFKDIEGELECLDLNAWKYLKEEIAPCLAKRDPRRGWRELFDRLNEAKGFKYLQGLGCQQVSFIRRSERATPDLEGWLAGERFLCEVKTMNISEDESVRRRTGAVGNTVRELPDAFLNKLKNCICSARRQMIDFDTDGRSQKIAFLVINFDDILNEYVDDYRRQIELFLNDNPPQDVKVVLHMKPKYYSASTD
jgi:hypothetical protein